MARPPGVSSSGMSAIVDDKGTQEARPMPIKDVFLLALYERPLLLIVFENDF